MPRPRNAAVIVDHELTWVVPLPEVGVGAVLTASPRSLQRLGDVLDAQARSSRRDGYAAGVVDAAARIVAAYLSDLPDLPFIGEPFGGEEGTD